MADNLNSAELSHVLSLLMQHSVANRTDTVTRQINNRALEKIDALLDQARDAEEEVDEEQAVEDAFYGPFTTQRQRDEDAFGGVR